MSAWDIAGAIVWTPIAVILWSFLFRGGYDWSEHGAGNALTFSIALISSSLAAIYCIARLFGAHA